MYLAGVSVRRVEDIAIPHIPIIPFPVQEFP